MYKRRSAQCSVHCTSDIVDNTMQTYSLITTKSRMGARQDKPSSEGAGLVQGRGGSVQTAAHRVSAATGSMQHQRRPAERRVAKPCTRVLVHAVVPRRGPPRLLSACSFASRRAPSPSAPRPRGRSQRRLLYDGSRQTPPPQLWAQPAVVAAASAAASAAAVLFCPHCVPSISEPSTASRRVASPKRRCAQRTAGTQGILRCTHIERISSGLRVDRQRGMALQVRGA